MGRVAEAARSLGWGLRGWAEEASRKDLELKASPIFSLNRPDREGDAALRRQSGEASGRWGAAQEVLGRRGLCGLKGIMAWARPGRRRTGLLDWTRCVADYHLLPDSPSCRPPSVCALCARRCVVALPVSPALPFGCALGLSPLQGTCLI